MPEAGKLGAGRGRSTGPSACTHRGAGCTLGSPQLYSQTSVLASQQVKGGDEDALAGTGGPKELEGKPSPACPGLGAGGSPGPACRSRELLGSRAGPHSNSSAGLATFPVGTFGRIGAEDRCAAPVCGLAAGSFQKPRGQRPERSLVLPRSLEPRVLRENVPLLESGS